MPATARGIQEARSGARVRIPGWATIECVDTPLKSDRLYDISHAGVALFLDIQLPLHREYRLSLSLYRHGKLHLLDPLAHCVYATLAGVSGFRHGFNFSSMSDSDQETLAQLLA